MNTIRCPYNHHDCFQALGVGNIRCKILTAPIAGGECPFYKTEQEVEDGRMEAHMRLKEMNRYDLIQQYEYNSARNW